MGRVPEAAVRYPALVARVTVFGAGAMGTAFAMHLARIGNDTVLWASEFDANVLPSLTEDRRHPGLPEHLPDSLRVLGPDELDSAAAGIDVAVMGAHSGGARTLARIVADGSDHLPLVVGVAKGLEPETRKRMSEVYAEEVGHDHVVSVGGPGLAPEVAEGLPTAVVFAAKDRVPAEQGAASFRSKSLWVEVTDDVVGVEYCTVIKNVIAIGMGILDGLGKGMDLGYRNAKSALFTQAFAEMTQLVTALGGRTETVTGLAGLGDTLVTSLGGRNRLYGELLGEGSKPDTALTELTERGMTVEGVDSTREVRALCEQTGLRLPILDQVHEVLFDTAPAAGILERMKG
jgi:glycerol-3-phosphate dehydrogenase (NAD(P)+)